MKRLLATLVAIAIATTLGLVGVSAPAQAVVPAGVTPWFDPQMCEYGTTIVPWGLSQFSGIDVNHKVVVNGQTNSERTVSGDTIATGKVDLSDFPSGTPYTIDQMVNGELALTVSGTTDACDPPAGVTGTIGQPTCYESAFGWLLQYPVAVENGSSATLWANISQNGVKDSLGRSVPAGSRLEDVLYGNPLAAGTPFSTGLYADGRTVATASGVAPTCGPAPVTVTAAAPVFNDQCGTANDTYAIPSTEGVVYKIGGTIVTAGTYPGVGSITVTAEATVGYVLTGDFSWTYAFTNVACPPPPPPPVTPPPSPPVTPTTTPPPPPPPAVIKVVKAPVITKALPKRLVKAGRVYTLYVGAYSPATVKKTVQWQVGVPKGKRIIWSRVRGATKLVFKAPKPGLRVRACVTVSRVGRTARVVCTLDYRAIR